MGECKNQLWISEVWKTTSEEWSKRMGVKEERKLAEDRIFFSYLIRLRILPQRKVSQHFSMSTNVYLNSPKKPPSQCNCALALL